MIFDIFIEPHERYEAVEAYADRLSPTQIETITDAPETALIRLQISDSSTQVLVIEEG